MVHEKRVFFFCSSLYFVDEHLVLFQVCWREEEMLVLFETPAGFALFKVLDEAKLSKVEVIFLLIFRQPKFSFFFLSICH